MTADRQIHQRLLFVTGKGGVGKSAVATALASASARGGRRTLLVVLQQPGSSHPQLGLTAAYQPRAVEANLDLCSVDGRSALKDYIHRTIPMAGLYDWFLDGRAMRHFIDAAPGFEELMCLGKLYDLVTDSDYALVVFDAPATGHAALMLRVPRTTGTAVRSGPIHTNALKIQRLLEDGDRTCVIVVALAEEMAVREALDLSDQIAALGITVGPTIANRVTPQLFSENEIVALDNLDDRSPTLQRLVETAAARYRRAGAEAEHIATLRNNRPWLVEVPQFVLARHDSGALIDAMVTHLGRVLPGNPP